MLLKYSIKAIHLRFTATHWEKNDLPIFRHKPEQAEHSEKDVILLYNNTENHIYFIIATYVAYSVSKKPDLMYTVCLEAALIILS